MKSLYVILISTVMLSGCARLGQRIAYGRPITLPQTPTEVVREVVEVKKEVDQAIQQVKQEKRQQKEDQYAAIQEKEQQANKTIAERNDVSILRDEVNELKRQNATLETVNSSLISSLSKAEDSITALKTDVEQLKKRLDDYVDRLLDGQSEQFRANLIKEGSKPVNLGEMTVIGNTSIRRATDGIISVRQGNTHQTYTPRSAPVRRSQQVYHLGPRGGCYYYTGSGRKEYVDRSLCH